MEGSMIDQDDRGSEGEFDPEIICYGCGIDYLMGEYGPDDLVKHPTKLNGKLCPECLQEFKGEGAQN